MEMPIHRNSFTLPFGLTYRLEAADNSEYFLEFLSGSATDTLSINLEGEATRLAGKHNLGDTTPPVTILDDCFHQVRKTTPCHDDSHTFC